MAGVDRISALPEDIKVSILSLLTIYDAARTSALSRSWRHLWTLVPRCHANLLVPEATAMLRRTEMFRHILSTLCGPICHFSCNYFHRSNQPPYLQGLLDLIFQKGGLCDLSLSCVGHRLQVQLPYFRLLKNLILYNVGISLSSDFGGFEQLSTLKLINVRISQQDIQLLIDRSNKLTSIKCLLWPKEDGAPPLSVMFNCPLLTYLYFYFGNNEAEARIISAPCLETTRINASLWLYAPLETLPWVGAATLKFLPDIAQVSHLSLHSTVLNCLSRVDVLHTLRVHFYQLRCLELIGEISDMDRRMQKVFYFLLRHMPFLEILKLKCKSIIKYEECPDELDSMPLNEYQDGFLCLHQTLRRVSICMDKLMNLKYLMWMMHFVLLNANVLELIKIAYCDVILWSNQGYVSNWVKLRKLL